MMTEQDLKDSVRELYFLSIFPQMEKVEMAKKVMKRYNIDLNPKLQAAFEDAIWQGYVRGVEVTK